LKKRSVMNSALIEGLYNSANIGIIIANEHGSIIQVNPFLEEITGYSQSQLLGRGFLQYCLATEDLQERFHRKVISTYKAPFDDLDIFLLGKENNKIAVHIKGFSFTQKDSSYAAVLVEDVTNRKAYEKVIESSFDKFIQTTLDLDAAMKKIKLQRKVLEDYKRKMIRELEVAKGVQKAIIPGEFPETPFFSIYGLSLPSEELGGDYFDFFPLSEGRMGILVADVSGHGVPSSLITTMVKAYFEYYTKEHVDPARVLTLINHEVSEMLHDTGFFLTAIYGVLSREGTEITLSLAGHDRALVLDRQGRVSELGEEAQGPVLGVIADAVYQSQTYPLEGKEKILFYTDGFPEARDSKGAFFGVESLQKFLKKERALSPKDFCHTLVKQVDQFYKGAQPNDDRTLVCINLTSAEAPVEEEDTLGRLLKKKAYQEAKEYITQQGLANSVSPQIQYYCGLLSFQQRDYQGAKEAFQRAIELNPEQAFCLYYLGRIALLEERLAEGKQYFEKALAINPDLSEAQKAIDQI